MSSPNEGFHRQWWSTCSGAETVFNSPTALPKHPRSSSSSTRSYGDKVIMVCKHFSIGYCQKGDNCPFLHPTDDHSSEIHSHDNSVSIAPPCRFYNAGYCRKGSQCSFLHNSTVPLKEVVSRKSPPFLCKYFKKFGECRFGEACNFIHSHQLDATYSDCNITTATDNPSNFVDQCATVDDDDDDNKFSYTDAHDACCLEFESSNNPDEVADDFEDKVNKIRVVVRTIAAMTYKFESQAKNLDLVIVMDCTHSMARWIQEAKDRIKEILNEVKINYRESKVRIGFVAYRDYCDGDLHCNFISLTEDVEVVENFIASQKAFGGGDDPEDISIGLQRALQMDWQAGARAIILVCDEPCHGSLYHNYGIYGDSELSRNQMIYSPDVSDLVRRIAQSGIDLTVLEVKNHATKKMVSALSTAYRLAPPPRDGSKRQFRAIPWGNIGASTVSTFFKPTLIQVAQSSIEASLSRYSTLSSRESWRYDHGGEARKSNVLGGIQEVDEDEDNETWLCDNHLTSPSYTMQSSLDFGNLILRFPMEPAVRYTIYLRPTGLTKHHLAFKVVKQDTFIKLDRTYFAEGSMRTAHAMYDVNINKVGVGKVYKSRKVQCNFDIVERDANSQAVAKFLAREFSIRCSQYSFPPIDFVLASFYQLKNALDSDPFMVFAAEPFLDGSYKKYNSNNGWHSLQYEDPVGNIAEAFSHFTFQYTRGSYMVVDCQGVGTIFTDPQIHSFSPEGRLLFGEGNRGTHGMAEFFYHHECNDVCQRLNLSKILKPGGNMYPNNCRQVCCENHSSSLSLSCDLCGSLHDCNSDQFIHLATNQKQIFCSDCQSNVKILQDAVCQNKDCNAYFKFPSFWYSNMGMEFPKWCKSCRTKK